MVLFNYSTKELTAKIVYYGPGLCGKTTNLLFIHGNLTDDIKGKMLSLATKTDRTLFFDFLPLDLGNIRGMKTRVQLYTVPGQVFYNETRKLVLKGADGIVFVADSQEQMMGPNVESFRNLEENLKAHGMNLASMPHVIQFNKRDLPRLSSIEDMNAGINKYNAPFYESVATTGIGIQDTLKAITKLVLLNLTKKYDPKMAGAAAESFPPQTKDIPAQSPAPDMVTPPPVVPVAAATVESIPLSEAPPIPGLTEVAEKPTAASVPPPPDFGIGEARPSVSMSTFGDSEIDDLVGELEDTSELFGDEPFDPPEAPMEIGTVAEHESSRAVDESEPDREAEILEEFPSLAGIDPTQDGSQTVIIPPMPVMDAGAPESDAPAPETFSGQAEQTPAMVASGLDEVEEVSQAPLEIDRGFDPEWTPESPAGGEQSWDGGGTGGGLQVAGEDSGSMPPPPPFAAITDEPAEEILAPPFAPFEEEDEVLEEDACDAVDEPEPILLEEVDEPAEDVPVLLEDQDEPVEDAPVLLTEVAEPEEDGPVLLTEVADDDMSLFEDSGLDVVRMESGESRAIEIPVEVKDGEDTKRYKLSVTLSLDTVD